MKPTAKEVRTPKIIATALISVAKRAGILIKDAPAIIGIERAKEKIAASLLPRPRNRPLVIVTPEREVPGISASA